MKDTEWDMHTQMGGLKPGLQEDLLFGHLYFLGQENKKESQDQVSHNMDLLFYIIRSLA